MKGRLRVIRAGNWWVLHGTDILDGPIAGHGEAMDRAIALVGDMVHHIEPTA